MVGLFSSCPAQDVLIGPEGCNGDITPIDMALGGDHIQSANANNKKAEIIDQSNPGDLVIIDYHGPDGPVRPLGLKILPL